jgi:acetyl-CoA carboxylase alpha subunit
MIIRDELNRELGFACDELIDMLREIKNHREQEVNDLKHKIKRYEEKKRAEETFYRSLSPVRKFFASRPPSHHQAVEYMVHVKERLKQIDVIKQRIRQIDHVIGLCSDNPSEEEVEVSSVMTEEIIKFRKGQV